MKQSQNQKLWQKEIKRIKSFIKRAEKKGYTFDYNIPETPKRVTKQSLRELKSETTPTKMYAKSTWTDWVSGETESGKEHKKQVRKEAGLKAQKTKKQKAFREGKITAPSITSVTFSSLKEFLLQYSQAPELTQNRNRGWTPYTEAIFAKYHSANMLLDLLQAKIAEEGESAVYQRLQDNAVEINSLMADFTLASKANQVQACTTSFATIINGKSLTMEEAKELDEAYIGMEMDFFVS